MPGSTADPPVLSSAGLGGAGKQRWAVAGGHQAAGSRPAGRPTTLAFMDGEQNAPPRGRDGRGEGTSTLSAIVIQQQMQQCMW
jgi:hypothetical protein